VGCSPAPVVLRKGALLRRLGPPGEQRSMFRVVNDEWFEFAERGLAAFVKSFGRRLAYESLRRPNPRCAVSDLWGFEDLVVLGRAGLVFARLLGNGLRDVLPGDQGSEPRPLIGNIVDDVGVWRT
jgi:hypothetical protein